MGSNSGCSHMRAALHQPPLYLQLKFIMPFSLFEDIRNSGIMTIQRGRIWLLVSVYWAKVPWSMLNWTFFSLFWLFPACVGNGLFLFRLSALGEPTMTNRISWAFSTLPSYQLQTRSLKLAQDHWQQVASPYNNSRGEYWEYTNISGVFSVSLSLRTKIPPYTRFSLVH